MINTNKIMYSNVTKKLNTMLTQLKIIQMYSSCSSQYYTGLFKKVKIQS